MLLQLYIMRQKMTARKIDRIAIEKHNIYNSPGLPSICKDCGIPYVEPDMDVYFTIINETKHDS